MTAHSNNKSVSGFNNSSISDSDSDSESSDLIDNIHGMINDVEVIKFNKAIDYLSEFMDKYTAQKNWLTQLKTLLQTYCNVFSELKFGFGGVPILDPLIVYRVETFMTRYKFSMEQKDLVTTLWRYVEIESTLSTALNYKLDFQDHLKSLTIDENNFYGFFDALSFHLPMLSDSQNQVLQNSITTILNNTANSKQKIIAKKCLIRRKLTEVQKEVDEVSQLINNLGNVYDQYKANKRKIVDAEKTERDQVFRNLINTGNQLMRIAKEVGQENKAIILHLKYMKGLPKSFFAKISEMFSEEN